MKNGFASQATTVEALRRRVAPDAGPVNHCVGAIAVAVVRLLWSNGSKTVFIDSTIENTPDRPG